MRFLKRKFKFPDSCDNMKSLECLVLLTSPLFGYCSTLSSFSSVHNNFKFQCSAFVTGHQISFHWISIWDVFAFWIGLRFRFWHGSVSWVFSSFVDKCKVKWFLMYFVAYFKVFFNLCFKFSSLRALSQRIALLKHSSANIRNSFSRISSS